MRTSQSRSAARGSHFSSGAPNPASGRWRGITFPRVNNAIMGKEVAMLLMLELPERGCWQVTGNYKSDHLSWVTWID